MRRYVQQSGTEESPELLLLCAFKTGMIQLMTNQSTDGVAVSMSPSTVPYGFWSLSNSVHLEIVMVCSSSVHVFSVCVCSLAINQSLSVN